MSINNSNLISVSEAADIVGCTMRHIRKLVERGDIKGEKLHPRAIVVYRRSVESYANKDIRRGRPRLGSKKD